MGGCCGFCGHVFIVYALYLSLINAVLMSAVIDTSEQQSGLTQCVDWFPSQHSRPWRGAKPFLRLVSKRRNRKTDG